MAYWDLWGPMFLRCGTYGIRMGLWDCGVGLMGPMATDGSAVCDLGNYLWDGCKILMGFV